MLTISELAKAGGVGVETIRFYQRRKLLEAPAKPRRDAGIRHYGESDIRQLRFIRTAQQAGFTLSRKSLNCWRSIKEEIADGCVKWHGRA
jgi:MerR family mercuric resistance operon transcriptional regulator